MLNMCDPPTHTRIRGLVSRGLHAEGGSSALRPVPARARAARDRRRRSRPRGDLRLPRRRRRRAPAADDRPDPGRARRRTGTSSSPGRRRSSTSATATSKSTTDELADAALGMRGYGEDLIDEKRARPADDMLSAVVHATLEGADGEVEALTPRSSARSSACCSSAGSETTRNSIAGGVLALIERAGPAGRAAGRPLARAGRGRGDPAVDERDGVQPAHRDPRRRARRRQLIRAGEKTTHWYPSANRDEAVFADPFRFDVARDPNPHVAFGGGHPPLPRRGAGPDSRSRRHARGARSTAAPASSSPARSSGAAATSTRASATSRFALQPA